MSTSRSIRRAAERRARKQARKDARQTELVPNAPLSESDLLPEDIECRDMQSDSQSDSESQSDSGSQSDSEPEPPLVTPISQQRLEANHSNAQLSTGPKSQAGKAASSKNALKTALTGRTVLLPGDDAELYADRLAEYERLYRPMGVREIEIVQALCDAWWRLDRIPGLIEALYVKGFKQFKERVRDLEPAEQPAMLRVETYLAYERQFRNLELQERRLSNHAEKLKSELEIIRKERFAREAEQYAKAAILYIAAKKDGRHFNPADYGFDFSTDNVRTYLEARRARHISDQAINNSEFAPPPFKTKAA